MGYFTPSTGTRNIKSLPGMLSFHGAYITAGSFNSETGLCKLSGAARDSVASVCVQEMPMRCLGRLVQASRIPPKAWMCAWRL